MMVSSGVSPWRLYVNTAIPAEEARQRSSHHPLAMHGFCMWNQVIHCVLLAAAEVVRQHRDPCQSGTPRARVIVCGSLTTAVADDSSPSAISTSQWHGAAKGTTPSPRTFPLVLERDAGCKVHARLLVLHPRRGNACWHPRPEQHRHHR
jgi:hypothetical protein